MEFYLELLSKILAEKIPAEQGNNTESFLLKLLECRSYQALHEIKRILEDDSLRDPECFEKIEAIVCLFEELGSGCGNRHDFS